MKNEFKNHQLKYGLNLKKNFSIGVGFDYLSQSYDKIGGLLYASKWFSVPKISTTFSTSIFNNQINYKVEIFKDVNFNNRFFIKRISFGMAYEDFMEYKDFYFGFRVLM